jgi:RHS repeat-associated protein
VDKASGSTYGLHTDVQGAVRVITDRQANVVETYYNDEYGNPLITLSASVPNNAAAQPLQYTAEPRDGETGLIYLRARMYDPSSGRFLQRGKASGNTNSPRVPGPL